MKISGSPNQGWLGSVTALVIALAVSAAASCIAIAEELAPLIKKGKPVDWWFVFKLNSEHFPGYLGKADRQCIFGGKPMRYSHFGHQYVFATSAEPTLKASAGCLNHSGLQTTGAKALLCDILHRELAPGPPS